MKSPESPYTVSQTTTLTLRHQNPLIALKILNYICHQTVQT